jgi:hypothetical protein
MVGIRVNPHRFRHAAATLLSIHDPANVRQLPSSRLNTFDETNTRHQAI